MTAIPISLLIHSAELYKNNFIGDFNREASDEPVILRYIRIDGRKAINLDGVKGFNDKASGGATLFYDYRNSLPHGVEFSIGQKIVFDGRRYIVGAVKVLYDRSSVHHAEVSLEEVGI